jgi:hypothetical protein
MQKATPNSYKVTKYPHVLGTVSALYISKRTLINNNVCIWLKSYRDQRPLKIQI